MFKNNEVCVKLLLERGVFVDVRDYNNDILLSWVVRKGNFEVMKLLLDYNVCVNLRNVKGEILMSRILYL